MTPYRHVGSTLPRTSFDVQRADSRKISQAGCHRTPYRHVGRTLPQTSTDVLKGRNSRKSSRMLYDAL